MHIEIMREFRSWSGYEVFVRTVTREARYILDGEAKEFLEVVLATCSPRILSVPLGTIYWRAQLGHAWGKALPPYEKLDGREPFPPTRMTPLPQFASEGRVNPKGISCLYLASDKETSISEVRPWVGKFVSTARFKTTKPLLTLIDCSVAHSDDYVFYFEEPSPPEREQAVWRDIDRAFSQPVNLDDSTAEYVPTQILAELFRKNGFDGVIYKSCLGPGSNIALFDVSTANLVDRSLYSVEGVQFSFTEIGKSI